VLGVAREIKKSNFETKIFWKIKINFCSKKNVSQFGSAVWSAIANIKIYNIYIYEKRAFFI